MAQKMEGFIGSEDIEDKFVHDTLFGEGSIARYIEGINSQIEELNHDEFEGLEVLHFGGLLFSAEAESIFTMVIGQYSYMSSLYIIIGNPGVLVQMELDLKEYRRFPLSRDADRSAVFLDKSFSSVMPVDRSLPSVVISNHISLVDIDGVHTLTNDTGCNTSFYVPANWYLLKTYLSMNPLPSTSTAKRSSEYYACERPDQRSFAQYIQQTGVTVTTWFEEQLEYDDRMARILALMIEPNLNVPIHMRQHQ
jgi:hypothetical protein